MAKSIKLKNETYWDSSSVTTNSSGTKLSAVVKPNGDISAPNVIYSGGGVYTNGKTGINDGHAGVVLNSGGIEISHSSTPYIDFHYANSTADYTSRIIEERSGVLKATGAFLKGGNTTHVYSAFLTSVVTTNTYHQLYETTITSHGGRFIIFGRLGGFKTSSGNSYLYANIDGTVTQLATTNQTTSYPLFGIVTIGTLSAGNHTIKFGVQANNTNYTATVEPYRTNTYGIIEY